MTASYKEKTTLIDKDNNIQIFTKNYGLKVLPKTNTKLGVMIVGLGGSNGVTLVSSLLAYKKGITWLTKEGNQSVKFYGSLSQYGSVHMGYDINNNPGSMLFKDVGDFYDPKDIVIDGWDICSDNLYVAAKKAKVLEPSLLLQIRDELEKMSPLKSFVKSNFIASNQSSRFSNVYDSVNLTVKNMISIVESDILNFKQKNQLNKIIVIWSASTERFSNKKWFTEESLNEDIFSDHPEISPSMIFAIASINQGCIFLNGSPQNTLCPALIEKARKAKTFVAGEDFKTGQTKLKSVLADFLVSSGIKPLSIVSYNHLGNNDGKNLDSYDQFKSKELTKKNVIDDVIEANPSLFGEDRPDHCVVIKYVPAVGDTKKAIDEYYSELMLGGHHTLIIHNTCEDSLLATGVILDLILFSEFLSRIRILEEINGKELESSLDTTLSYLSYFFKSPLVNENEPIINSYFKQRSALENLFRALIGLPPVDYINLGWRRN